MDPGIEFWQRVADYWPYGVLGGLIQDLITGGGLTVPKWDITCRRLRLGVFGSMFLGLAAATLVDGSIVTALASAIAGPYVIEEIVGKFGARLGKART
jgi:hypothetical protein